MKKLQEQKLKRQMSISDRKPIAERPDIGRPVIFTDMKTMLKIRNSKAARRELKKQLSDI